MTTLIYAIGNPLRRDDGVARRIMQLLGKGAWVAHEPRELLPEMAEEVSAAARVVFVDADLAPGEVQIESVEPAGSPGLLSHGLRPCDLLSLARELYGFSGEAWLCRVPGEDFGEGEGLSPKAEAHAAKAAGLLAELLG